MYLNYTELQWRWLSEGKFQRDRATPHGLYFYVLDPECIMVLQ